MKTNLLPILKTLMPQIILMAVIYIVVLTLPNRNIISINLSIIIPILMYKIYNRQKPILKDWIKTIMVTAGWTTGIILIYKLLGGLGIIGGILIIIIFVTWRIWKGRKLFNYTTKWGANILRGKPEDFDINQLKEDKDTINK